MVARRYCTILPYITVGIPRHSEPHAIMDTAAISSSSTGDGRVTPDVARSRVRELATTKLIMEGQSSGR